MDDKNNFVFKDKDTTINFQGLSLKQLKNILELAVCLVDDKQYKKLESIHKQKYKNSQIRMCVDDENGIDTIVELTRCGDLFDITMGTNLDPITAINSKNLTKKQFQLFIKELDAFIKK